MPKKNATRRYRGKTTAYFLFMENLWNTEQLLDFGPLGIEQELERKYKPLLKKFADVKGIPGRRPKDYEAAITAKRDPKDGSVRVEMDQRSAVLVKTALQHAQRRHEGLRYFFYLSMAASTWAAFETYFQMLYGELFRRSPAMLKSGNAISYAEVVEHNKEILEYLSEQQVEKIGRMTLQELMDYNEKKLKISFSVAARKKLEGYYFIRNVIAHNSGMIRASQRKRLPEGVNTVDGRIRVSKSYLVRMIRDIRLSITFFERRVDMKFFRSKASSASLA